MSLSRSHTPVITTDWAALHQVSVSLVIILSLSKYFLWHQPNLFLFFVRWWNQRLQAMQLRVKIFLSYHVCFWFIFSVCFFFQFLFDCLFDSSCSGFWAFKLLVRDSFKILIRRFRKRKWIRTNEAWDVFWARIIPSVFNLLNVPEVLSVKVLEFYAVIFVKKLVIFPRIFKSKEHILLFFILFYNFFNFWNG